MFLVYRDFDCAEDLLTNSCTGDKIFFDMKTLKQEVEKNAEELLYDDGDLVTYTIIDLKNKTFKTLTVYYILTYTTEIEIED